MSWTTVVWSMHAAACLTLMAVYLVIGLRRPGRQDLYFALTAFGAAAMAFGGIVMMQAKTTAQLAEAIRWLHVPVWILAVSFVLFVRSGLKAGNPILGWGVIAVRTAALVVNFLHAPNLNYDRITGVGTIVLWGERISVTEGVRSPWSTLGETAAFLLVVFLIGATREVWRRGDRRRAVLVCGSMLFVAIVSWLHTTLVHAGIFRSPYVISVVYIVVVIAMYAELTRQVVEGAELGDRLREAERRAALSDEAAGIGHWTWDVSGAEALDGRPGASPLRPAPRRSTRNRADPAVDRQRGWREPAPVDPSLTPESRRVRARVRPLASRRRTAVDLQPRPDREGRDRKHRPSSRRLARHHPEPHGGARSGETAQ